MLELEKAAVESFIVSSIIITLLLSYYYIIVSESIAVYMYIVAHVSRVLQKIEAGKLEEDLKELVGEMKERLTEAAKQLKLKNK